MATSDYLCPAYGLDLERWAQGGQAAYRNPATGATLEEMRGSAQAAASEQSYGRDGNRPVRRCFAVLAVPASAGPDPPR